MQDIDDGHDVVELFGPRIGHALAFEGEVRPGSDFLDSRRILVRGMGSSRSCRCFGGCRESRPNRSIIPPVWRTIADSSLTNERRTGPPNRPER